MATGKDKKVIYEKIREYVKTLEKNKVPVWRLYLYGSYAKTHFIPTVILIWLCSGIATILTGWTRMFN